MLVSKLFSQLNLIPKQKKIYMNTPFFNCLRYIKVTQQKAGYSVI